MGPAGGATAGAAAGVVIGAITGVATGGLAASLIHLGHPDDDAHALNSAVMNGRTLVTVWARARAQAVRDILHQSGGALNGPSGTPLAESSGTAATNVNVSGGGATTVTSTSTDRGNHGPTGHHRG